ncbi:MAG TPA: hypothetical protein VEL07_03005 [Planctomycetota bacterium]|nr:hypothetical protein [Planctomycetota bacterium]
MMLHATRHRARHRRLLGAIATVGVRTSRLFATRLLRKLPRRARRVYDVNPPAANLLRQDPLMRYRSTLRLTAAVACLAMLPTLLGAVDLDVRASVPLTTAYPDYMLSEIYIAADPASDDRIIATANRSRGDSAAPESRPLVFVSDDGGAQWTTKTFLLGEPGASNATGDPMVYWTPEGRALFSGFNPVQTIFHTSDDKGSTWTRAAAPKVGDHIRLAVDPRPSSRRVYGIFSDNGGSTHRLRVGRSDDGGATWGAFATVPGIGDANHWVLNMNKAVVLSDGTCVIPYREWDLTVPASLEGTVDLKITTTTDGTAFSAPTKAATIPYPHDPAVSVSAQKRTFQEGFYSPADPASSPRVRHGVASNPVLAVAPDGPWKDRLYLTWEASESVTSATGRLRTRVWLTYSDDRGASWSTPARIEASPPMASRQGRPDVAVSADGTVLVVWVDTRGHVESDPTGENPGEPFRFTMMAAASVDGGVTFGVPQAVSDAVSQPDFWNEFTYRYNWDEGWGHFGDETGFVDGGRGTVFHAAWPDARTVALAQVRYARVRVVAPTGFNAEPGTGGIVLSWNDNSSDEIGFRIERRVSGGAWEVKATTAAEATSWTDTTAAQGVTYTYRVVTLRSIGTATSRERSASLSASSRTIIAPTPVPTDLQGSYIPVFFESGMRCAVVYDDSLFQAAGPCRITSLAFRAREASAVDIAQLRIVMGIAASTSHPDDIPQDSGNDTPFAGIIGSRSTTVYNGAFHATSRGDGSFDVVMTLATPFDYDPQWGNLVVEFTGSGTGTRRLVDLNYTTVRDGAGTCSRLSTTEADGFWSQYTAPITRFTTIAIPTTNQPPQVSAGPDRSVTLPATAALAGSASDDGLPNNTLTTTWSKVSGPGTVSFSAPSSPTSNASFSVAGTYVLRLTASDGSASASDDTSVVVTPAATMPAITTQPADRSVVAPTTATFTVAASGSPAPTYQWQSAPPGSSTFGAISGATAASYTTGATSAAMSGTRYRCIATNSAGSATSSAATLTMSPVTGGGATGTTGTGSTGGASGSTTGAGDVGCGRGGGVAAAVGLGLMLALNLRRSRG